MDPDTVPLREVRALGYPRGANILKDHFAMLMPMAKQVRSIRSGGLHHEDEPDNRASCTSLGRVADRARRWQNYHIALINGAD